MKSPLLVLNTPKITQTLETPAEKILSALMDFKATERKDDPDRRHNIRGPIEVQTLRRTGRLPRACYAEGDDTPWGLRVEESRRNIVWQVLSGAMDNHPEYGAEYMALALDVSLGDDDYAKELEKLNKSWGDYCDTSVFFGDHQHTSMSHTYERVSCPACSMLAALAIRDKGMHTVFKEMLDYDSPKDRREFLAQKGLTELLDMMIPEKQDQPKLIISGS